MKDRKYNWIDVEINPPKENEEYLFYVATYKLGMLCVTGKLFTLGNGQLAIRAYGDCVFTNVMAWHIG